MRYGPALRRALLAGLLALLAFAPGISLPGTAKLGLGGPALAQDVFAIDQFYDELAPYGEWVPHPAYGYVWLPLSVPENWRPYTVGRWISTDEYGWYWDSPEPFAWAVYHYGRWGFDPAYGWYWVPGDTWAPAWVQWRYGTSYVGWAPLEPDSYRGYAYGGPAAYSPPPPPRAWVFVRPRYLTAPVIDRYVLPPRDVTIALNFAPYVYRPEFRNGYVYNYGMPRDRWSRITHQHAQPRRIYRGNQRAYPRGWRGHNNRELYVYAPGVKKGAGPRRPPRKVSHKPSKAKNHNKPSKARNGGGPKQYNWTRGATFGTPQVRGRPEINNPSVRGPLSGAPRGRWNGYGSEPHALKPPGKDKTAKGDAVRHKGAKPQAKRAKPTSTAKAEKAKGAKAKNARVQDDKAKPPHIKAAKAKASQPGGANVKAANAKAAKVRADKARMARAKAANAKPARAKALAPQANTADVKPKKGGGDGKHHGGGDGKHHGGNREAACKANPALAFCQRRGG